MDQFDKEPSSFLPGFANLNVHEIGRTPLSVAVDSDHFNEKGSGDTECFFFIEEEDEQSKKENKGTFAGAHVESKNVKEFQHYTPDIFVSLLRSMRKTTYYDRGNSGKSMKEIFEKAVQHAKEDVIERSAIGWERKFGRLKSAFSKYMAKRSHWWACGQSTFHAKPLFFDEMYDREPHNARHSPLSIIDPGVDGTELEENSKQKTSSRKRARTAQLKVIEEYVENPNERFQGMLLVTEEGSKTLQRLADAPITFLARP